MPRGKPFEPGHKKLGGRRRGGINNRTLARQQAVAESLEALGLSAAAIDTITPLAVMRLVMTVKLKAGDYNGALFAANCAAPYVHPRLASSDLRIRDEHIGKSDEQLQAEIEELEHRIKAAETLH
jgi:hypothetical protein